MKAPHLIEQANQLHRTGLAAKSQCHERDSRRWRQSVVGAMVLIAGTMLAATIASAQTNPSEDGVVDDMETVNEDGMVEIDVLANDVADGTLTIHVPRQSMNKGQVRLLQSDAVLYQPFPDFNGTDTFTYELYSNGERQGEATVTVNVSAVDDEPVFAYIPASARRLTENEDLAFSMLYTDADTTDAGKYTRTIQFVRGRQRLATAGSIDLDAGTYSYTPEEEDDDPQNARFTFTLTHSDTSATFVSPTIVAKFFEVNRQPTATISDAAPTATVGEQLTVSVTFADEDLINHRAQAITVTVEGDTDVDTTTANGFTWTPEAADWAETHFSVIGTDAAGAAAVLRVTVTIATGATAVPTLAARHDVYVIAEDTSTQMEVAANDVGASGATVTIVQGSGPTNGTAQPAGTGVWYVPTANYHGDDSFEYQIASGGTTSTATVTVIVEPANDKPVLNVPASDITFPEGETTTWNPPGVLAEVVSDPDGDTLGAETLALYLEGDVPYGLSFDEFTGRMNWTPSERSDQPPIALKLGVKDSAGVPVTQDIRLVVDENNQAPGLDARSMQYAVAGQLMRFTLTAEDPDIIGGERQALTFTKVTGPEDLTISGTTGVVQWTPPQTAAAFEPVRVQVTDAAGATDTAIIYISVATSPPRPLQQLSADPQAPDPNGDGVLNGADAQVMYYAFELEDLLGDGQQGGFDWFRQTFLGGLIASEFRDDQTQLQRMISAVNSIRTHGQDSPSDINQDGEVDSSDAVILYYATELRDLLGDGQTGGLAQLRHALLQTLVQAADRNETGYQRVLQRVNTLTAAVRNR